MCFVPSGYINCAYHSPSQFGGENWIAIVHGENVAQSCRERMLQYVA